MTIPSKSYNMVTAKELHDLSPEGCFRDGSRFKLTTDTLPPILTRNTRLLTRSTYTQGIIPCPVGCGSYIAGGACMKLPHIWTPRISSRSAETHHPRWHTQDMQAVLAYKGEVAGKRTDACFSVRDL